MDELTQVQVRLLVENTARGAGILGEHGLSWHIESAGRSLLFDLGQGMTLASNARRMGVDWARVDSVVFSHGHYDHVGGWRKWWSQLQHARVFAHPAALELKYQAKADGGMHPAGDRHFAASLKSSSASVMLTEKPVEVLPGIWTTGEVPRTTDFEDTGGDFYAGNGATQEDDLLDDLSLFFRTDMGLVVVLGCAHAGLINILRHCIELTGERIHAVIGGMHLLHAREERIQRTLAALDEIGPDWLAPNHCTGDAALARIYQAYPDRALEMHAGQSMEFPLQSRKL